MGTFKNSKECWRARAKEFVARAVGVAGNLDVLSTCAKADERYRPNWHDQLLDNQVCRQQAGKGASRCPSVDIPVNDDEYDVSVGDDPEQPADETAPGVADQDQAADERADAPIMITGDGCEWVEGNCIESRNYGRGSYPPSSACTINGLGDLGTPLIFANDPSLDLPTSQLETVGFATESSFDFLTISGTSYSGTVVVGDAQASSSSVLGGNDIVVSAGATVDWSADESVEGTGWKFCWVDPEQPADETAPGGDDQDQTADQTADAPIIMITGDGCEWVEGNCIESRNYGRDSYPASSACTINGLGDVGTPLIFANDPSLDLPTSQLETVGFATESSFDFLTISGTSYSGTIAALGGNDIVVDAGATVDWSADGSVETKGWKFCWVEEWVYPPGCEGGVCSGLGAGPTD